MQKIQAKRKGKNWNQDDTVVLLATLLLVILSITILYPIIYIISCSFSSGGALMSGKVKLLPVEFTLDGYKSVFEYKQIWVGYRNSILYTALGTLIAVCMTVLAAYPLSREDFVGRKILSRVFVFTMMFSGGMIPSFLLVKSLGILDTMWAVILPTGVSAYNVIVARTFFNQSIPKELLEAAQIDGCTDFKFFLRIVIPLSGAIMAVISLWVAVSLWNGYFNAMIYLNSDSKYTLQLVLRRILLLSKVDFSKGGAMDLELLAKNEHLSEMLKYGTIILSSLPLMLAYPFLQKYFVKGVMIGSVKG